MSQQAWGCTLLVYEHLLDPHGAQLDKRVGSCGLDVCVVVGEGPGKVEDGFRPLADVSVEGGDRLLADVLAGLAI